MVCSNETSVNNTVYTEDVFVSIICFVTSFLGLLINGLIAAALLKLEFMRNQFGYLSVSLAMADCGVLCIFLFWVSPITFWNNQYLALSIIGKKVGHLGIVFWFASLYATLAISVNRFVAVSMFNKYENLFSMEKTKKVTVCTWVIALLHALLYFYPGCDFVYDPTRYAFYYVKSACEPLTVFMDFGYGVIFITAVFVLNVVTGWKVHKHNKVAPIRKDQVEVRKRQKREIKFFVQSALNAIVFEIMLLSFHVISRFVTGKWALFFATTWIWQVSHGSNGFILLILNSDLREGLLRWIFCFKKAKPKTEANRKPKVGATDRNTALKNNLVF